jgi:succinyl-diaminopimelate desuccinylase
VHRLLRALSELVAHQLDTGTEWFEPSNLQVTSVDVGNPASNVIPAQASARLNIRFNDRHSGAALESWLRDVLSRHADRFDLSVSVSGEAFLTRPGPDVDRLVAAIARATGRTPRLDTGGGTSDARFIAQYCPVAEFGLVGATMHQQDECVPLAELEALTETYRATLSAFLR